MTDRHKHPPIPFRPPEQDRLWLLNLAERTGRPVNAILADALAAYRRDYTEDRTDFHGIPVVADARMPAGFVALVAPGQNPVVFRAPPTDGE